MLHVPTPALEVALGEMSGELLASAQVLPRRLLEAGYAFQHPDLSSALASPALTGKPPTRPCRPDPLHRLPGAREAHVVPRARRG